MTTEEKMNLPRYVPQGRPMVRTKNRMRPDWLDMIRRPLLIVALHEKQFERFTHFWKFDKSECAHVMLTNDLRGVSFGTVVLVLPGVRDDRQCSILDLNPLEWWENRGGVTVDIPVSALENPWHFSIEDNMAAATRLAIAQHRHLDSLNGK